MNILRLSAVALAAGCIANRGARGSGCGPEGCIPEILCGAGGDVADL